MSVSNILKIKIYAMIANGPDVDYYIKQGPYKTDRLNVRSVKVYVDGALGYETSSEFEGLYGVISKEVSILPS